MKVISGAGLTSFLASTVAATDIIGYGNRPYDPLCGMTCLRSFSSLMLDCSSMAASGMMSMTTTPECYAKSTPFLTSVAWCFDTKCAEFDVQVSDLETFWEQNVAGDSYRAILPKWSYSEALFNVNPRPPTYTVNSSDTWLNVTSIVAPDTYLHQWNALWAVYRESIVETSYSITIIVTALGLPILLTWLGFLPFVRTLFNKLRPYIVYPSLIGTYQVRPLPFLLGNAPTVGQGLYIAVFLLLNLLLLCVDYQSRQPNAWFGSQWQEINAYILYRSGTYAFVLAPVVFLFSSRNNILLWLTNWSHSTYLLLHRWVARVFTLYAVIHSIVGLMIYAQYATSAWWIWGAVATIASVILALGSGLYVRRFQYEIFLVTHVLLSVLVLVGCWYHLILWYDMEGMYFPYTWGYEDWLYFAIGVWFFDRAVRVGRVLKAGARRSRVTELADGYVRVDIPGVRWGSEPGLHVYAYFPTLTPLRPWENHPFSVIPSHLLQLSDQTVGMADDTSAAGSRHEDTEKQVQITSSTETSTHSRLPVGVTLFIKKSTGLTKFLRTHENLFTLLDGPYSNNSTKGVLRTDRLLLVGGGIGITGLLPWAFNHWNVKLAWSVKDSAKFLIDALDAPLKKINDKDVKVGGRLNIDELIAEEVAAGWASIGIVVSGPGGFCDDVRAAVSAAGRSTKAVFQLEVDAYSW